MAKTAIEWTDVVWNPITGCSKVSPGCEHCYAERMAKRLAGRAGYDKEQPFKVTWHGDDKLLLPMTWTSPRRVFVNSMGDLFHADVRGLWIEDVLDAIIHQPKHNFLVLTKRPQRMLEFMTRFYADGWVVGTEPRPLQLHHEPIANLWLGVTAENQEMADKRIPLLLQVPAAVRFISVEPMLGPVDIRPWIWKADNIVHDEPEWEGDIVEQLAALSWVIAGGETGPGARPMHPDWVRSVRDQCQAAGMPLFFKQWGEWSWEYPKDRSLAYMGETFLGGQHFYRVGKKVAGYLIDGVEHRQFPEVAA